MKKRTILILILLLLAFIIIILYYLFCNEKPKEQWSFMQQPPIATQFWVQQLKSPLSTGENMVFSVQYVSDSVLPEKIDIYENGEVVLTLRDDGKAPDKVQGDKKYASYKKENIREFVSQIENSELILERQRQFLSFTGHVGEVVHYKDIVKFDKNDFNDFKEVEISPKAIEVANCSTELLKEKSLFITDIAIVEDQSRTYNVFTGVGNPNGAWTFGTLMGNIENNTHTDGIRGFLKDWVKHWISVQIVNGYTVKARDFALVTMIEPWLRKANNNVTLDVNLSNWESIWDTTPENDIKINAPFKLTAIVNRIDERANMAYTATITNSGETRFIFSLINPLTGVIPINPNQTASAEQDGKGFFDWRGLNVIFEYGNPQTTRCELKDFAQKWLDLSDPAYNFGIPSINNPYKDALQQITDYVTLANAVPLKINGSAINRVRTNEKVFATFDDNIETHAAWEKQDWEFRQFELSATSKKLVMVPLTNNPDYTANYAPNIQEDYTTSTHPVTNNEIINWIFNGNKNRVLNGSFNMPEHLLSGSGIVRREQTQYFDLIPDEFASKGNYNPAVESSQAKQIRQQLSLNTCVGCHAGETKTVFTHISPLAYGEVARYWLTQLDGASNISQDAALYPWGGTDPLQLGGKNKGTTNGVINFDTQTEINNRDFFQALSPFLTGRRYFSHRAPVPPGYPNWEDDEPDNTNSSPNFDHSDNSLDWLFFVNDPSNDDDATFPYLSNKKWGYNDLERRKKDLCMFVNSNCSGSGTISNGTFELMKIIVFQPFPLGSH